jgi:hypothetical protein
LDGRVDEILSQCGGSDAGARYIVELGQWQPMLELVGTWKRAQQQGHPPGEARRLPNAPQRRGRVLVDEIASIALVELQSAQLRQRIVVAATATATEHGHQRQERCGRNVEHQFSEHL